MRTGHPTVTAGPETQVDAALYDVIGLRDRNSEILHERYTQIMHNMLDTDNFVRLFYALTFDCSGHSLVLLRIICVLLVVCFQKNK